MAARTFCRPVAILACTPLTWAGVKLDLTDGSSWQRFGAKIVDPRKSSRQDRTMLGKLKSLPPMATTTILTLCVAAKVCSIFAWPCWPAPLSEKSRPGLKWLGKSMDVDVAAPVQARLSPLTPPAICDSWDLLR